MSPPRGRPKEGSLPLGGKARSAKGAPMSAASVAPADARRLEELSLNAEARRRGAQRAYLQVTAANVAAIALYAHFGFTTAYDYWYRGLDR